MEKIELLQKLVEQVERSGANIAPTYHEYMPMAFGIANTCGEAGRGLFHRLCQPSPRYVEKDADRLYDNALRSGRNANSLGTVWHFADLAGVDLKGIARPEETPVPPAANPYNPYTFPPPLTHTQARTLYTENGFPTGPAGNCKEMEEEIERTEDEAVPAVFPDYAWPRFVQQGVDCGANKPQQDVLLLSMLTTLGATMADLVCFFYGNRKLHPCLQVFIIAPPASGKGAMGWARHLAQPVHDDLMRQYEQQCAIYRSEKQKWDGLGKERSSQPEPEKPKRRLFFISGDNTGTGIQENLIDQEGLGMISESEASILSAAISSDYGNWSHTLRKAFDHDGISYNRRTNYEHRECGRLLMTVLISGTPGQVRSLIPSAENGLFSRELFYHMPPITRWVSQFRTDSRDYNALFERWGQRWKRLLDALHQQVSQIELVLTEEQQETFDAQLAQIFQHGGAMYGYTMRSSVARLAINLLRLMSVVATLRALDPLLTTDDEETLADALEHLAGHLLSLPDLTAPKDTTPENVRDGVVTSFLVHIRPDDYQAVMALAEPLYRHAAHALAHLPEEKTEKREPSKLQRFVASLPMQFQRKAAVEAAEAVGWNEKTCETYLHRLCEKGALERVERGVYRFAPGYDVLFSPKE